jgi:adenosylhomocysteine nucleosidase
MTSFNRLGIVTGLKSESALILNALNDELPRPPIMVQCRGPGPERALLAAEILLGAGCTALLSFGLAGGLAPMHSSGTILLPRTILRLPAGDSSPGLAVDPTWHAALSSRFKRDSACRISTGPLVSVAHVVATTADKKSLYDLLGAAGVDMESHAVAQVAAQHGVPFVAVRMIMDPVEQSIPEALRAAMTEDGDVDTKAGLMALLRAPRLIGTARRLQRQSLSVHNQLDKLLRSDLLARSFLLGVGHE